MKRLFAVLVCASFIFASGCDVNQSAEAEGYLDGYLSAVKSCTPAMDAGSRYWGWGEWFESVNDEGSKILGKMFGSMTSLESIYGPISGLDHLIDQINHYGNTDFTPGEYRNSSSEFTYAKITEVPTSGLTIPYFGGINSDVTILFDGYVSQDTASEGRLKAAFSNNEQTGQQTFIATYRSKPSTGGSSNQTAVGYNTYYAKRNTSTGDIDIKVAFFFDYDNANAGFNGSIHLKGNELQKTFQVSLVTGGTNSANYRLGGGTVTENGKFTLLVSEGASTNTNGRFVTMSYAQLKSGTDMGALGYPKDQADLENETDVSKKHAIIGNAECLGLIANYPTTRDYLSWDW